MLSTLSPQEFVDLAQTQTKELLCSLYFPLESSGVDLRAKKLQLKNAINQLRAALEGMNGRAPDSGGILRALEGLESHPHFLNPASQGLAVLAPCSRPEAMKVLALDFAPQPAVSLGDHYMVSPLLRLFGSSRPRTVLALAENGLRMLKGTSHQLDPVALPDSFPTSRDEVIKFEKATGLDPKHSTQHRSGRGMAYHGEGPKETVEAEFTKRYYREIGQALHGMLDEQETILLAGVHERVALFRKVNPDLPLLFAELTGNYEAESVEALRAKALAVLSEVERNEVRLEIAETRELGLDWWSTNLDPCQEAARAGKVHTLFVNVASLTEPRLHELALEVLKHGGAIRTVEADSLETACLTRFRWSDSPSSASNVPV